MRVQCVKSRTHVLFFFVFFIDAQFHHDNSSSIEAAGGIHLSNGVGWEHIYRVQFKVNTL